MSLATDIRNAYDARDREMLERALRRVETMESIINAATTPCLACKGVGLDRYLNGEASCRSCRGTGKLSVAR